LRPVVEVTGSPAATDTVVTPEAPSYIQKPPATDEFTRRSRTWCVSVTGTAGGEHAGAVDHGRVFVSVNVSAKPGDGAESIGGQGALRVAQRPFRRAALLVCGTLSLALGVVGIFVPLLPTTCFLLIAAWCYARSSSRLYDRLMRARWIGSYLRRYRDERAIPVQVKVGSVVMMWITIGYSVVVFPNVMIRVALLLTAAAVTWHLYKLPSAK
jgi:uncharacterized protein